METKTMNQTPAANTTAANTNNEDTVIAHDLNRSRLEKMGDRLAKAALLETNASGLAQRGWPADETEGLKQQIAGLADLRLGQDEGRRVVAQAVSDQATAVQAAEVTRDRLAKGLRLFRARRAVDVPDAFLKLNPTTGSSDLLRRWFRDSRQYVLSVIPQMTVHMVGDPIALIDGAIANLQKKEDAVSDARKALTALYASGQSAQGEVKASVNALVWIAQTAFRNDPSSLLMFRKQHRVRKAVKKDEAKAVELKDQQNHAEPKAEQAKTEETKAA